MTLTIAINQLDVGITAACCLELGAHCGYLFWRIALSPPDGVFYGLMVGMMFLSEAH